MRQSQLFTKTLKEAPADETAVNAKLLARGGFVYKNSAGVYSYLPLGWRVIEKINKIIREEMNAIGGVEMLMPALVDRKYLEQTDRFKLDVGFDVLGKKDKKAPYALGWTHEEVLTAIASKYISSYKDLPKAIYQIQTKFRNEARAKSGILRGREFLMKDLYSFHVSEEDLFEYYEKVKEAYFNVFKRCGLDTYYALASGGEFTISNTHEFQAFADVGEDTILYCSQCRYAENSEISKLKEGGKCPNCEGNISKSNAIEVGNIFPLGTKYSEAFGLEFQDEEGKKIWPKEVAPFDAHLIYIPSRDSNVKKAADKLYDLLSPYGGSLVGRQKEGAEVLYDDRADSTAGEKFADADVIGLPIRIVISERTLKKDGVEIKKRDSDAGKIIKLEDVPKCFQNSSDISQKT